MLVLTEGFTATDPQVREACMKFFTPTVRAYAAKNDIAGVLKLIEARLAFGNQYYGRIPGYVTLAILEILEHDEDLANYFKRVVIYKLRRLAGIPTDLTRNRWQKRHQSQLPVDQEMEMDLIDEEALNPSKEVVSKDSEMQMDAQPESLRSEENPVASAGPVTFEEVLLLRLAFELNRSTSRMRTATYLDRLEEIIPEFEEFRQITLALAEMPEQCLPDVDPADKELNPYPKGQVGFTKSAILGEWIKFSLQLNISDELIRKNLTTLCFDLIAKVEYSFQDYEHLLRRQKQLLKYDILGSVPAVV